MPFAENFSISGTFTAPATLPGSININCGFVPNRVELINETEFGNLSSGFELIQNCWWDSASSANTNGYFINAGGTASLPFQLTSLGISPYAGTAVSVTGGFPISPNALGASITGTTIVKSTGVCTVSSTAGLQAGTIVVFSNLTVMKQLGGLGFQIATINSPTTFTITNPAFLNTANFSNESAFTIRPVVIPDLYYPGKSVITAITQAASGAVVTTSANHGLTVGQQVRILCPKQFGMTQINNLQGIISAVTAQTLTLGGTLSINSSGFSAFAWPAASAVPFTAARVISVGSGPSPVTFGNVTYDVDVLDDATLNNSFAGFSVGTNILQTATNSVIGIEASDVFVWRAFRGDV